MASQELLVARTEWPWLPCVGEEDCDTTGPERNQQIDLLHHVPTLPHKIGAGSLLRSTRLLVRLQRLQLVIEFDLQERLKALLTQWYIAKPTGDNDSI